MSLFAEAIRSAFLPCSFAILVPALVVTLVGKPNARIPALGAFLLGAAVFAWLPFYRITTPFDHNIGGAVAMGIGLYVLVTVAGIGPSVGAGALIGAFAGSTWIPCVGEQYGAILNTGLDNPPGALLPMVVYLLGVLMPIVVVLALIEFIGPVERTLSHTAVQRGAIGLGAVLAVIVLVGQYTTLMSELARRSSF